MSSRRAVVLGKGTLAIRIAQWCLDTDKYELVGVVPVVPEPDWSDSLIDWAADRGVPCVRSGDFRDLDVGEIDLAISVFYDRIVDESFIAGCGRILNVHNGALPQYRGVAPVDWALKNEERLHGVTLHELTAEVDAGPIVAQVLFSIYPELDEVVDVYEQALDHAWLLFEQTMPRLDRIEARPQDEAQATYYSAADRERLGDRRGVSRSG